MGHNSVQPVKSDSLAKTLLSQFFLHVRLHSIFYQMLLSNATYK